MLTRPRVSSLSCKSGKYSLINSSNTPVNTNTFLKTPENPNTFIENTPEKRKHFSAINLTTQYDLNEMVVNGSYLMHYDTQ